MAPPVVSDVTDNKLGDARRRDRSGHPSGVGHAARAAEVGVDGPRTNERYPDAAAGKFEREALDQAGHPELGARVCGFVRHTSQAGDGADEGDVPSVGVDHLRKHGLGELRGGAEVDVEESVEPIVIKVGERPVVADAGSMDDEVDVAVHGERLRREQLAAMRVGEVDGEWFGVVPVGGRVQAGPAAAVDSSRAPARHSRSLTALPMPPLAPVTSATDLQSCM